MTFHSLIQELSIVALQLDCHRLRLNKFAAAGWINEIVF